VLVCIQGSGKRNRSGVGYGAGKAEGWLLPAVAGTCVFHPGGAVTLLEIALRE
jgi:hypothetical protein